MKRTLLNCDQVFDVLTRGPFPTGEPEDDAVERHLRACHDCRQLAEALRPAVALLHEAITPDEALELPEYQGALPWKRPERRRLTMSRLASPSPANPKTRPAKPKTALPATAARTERPQSFIRLFAAALLVFAIGAIIFGFAAAPIGSKQIADVPKRLFSAADSATEFASSMPTEKGLLTLASLNLPATCLPLTHRPVSAEQATEIATALTNGSFGSLHCCTECHRAGLPREVVNHEGVNHIAALAKVNCQTCHRG